MDYKTFEKEMNALWEELRDKEAVIMANDYPELYDRYLAEYCSDWDDE